MIVHTSPACIIAIAEFALVAVAGCNFSEHYYFTAADTKARDMNQVCSFERGVLSTEPRFKAQDEPLCSDHDEHLC